MHWELLIKKNKEKKIALGIQSSHVIRRMLSFGPTGRENERSQPNGNSPHSSKRSS